MRDNRQTGLMAQLRQAATGPAGVRAVDVQGFEVHRVSSALWHLASRGELHRASLGWKRLHYFACPEKAAAFERENQERYVPPSRVLAPVERAEDRSAKTGTARAQRHDARQHETQRLRANAAPAPAAERPPVRITYGPRPTVGPLAGDCPADKPLVLRAGALDYQRYMVKHRHAEVQP